MVLRITENNLFLTFVKCTLAWPHKWYLELSSITATLGGLYSPGQGNVHSECRLMAGRCAEGVKFRKFLSCREWRKNDKYTAPYPADPAHSWVSLGHNYYCTSTPRHLALTWLCYHFVWMLFVTDKRTILFKGTLILYIKEEWWGTVVCLSK